MFVLQISAFSSASETDAVLRSDCTLRNNYVEYLKLPAFVREKAIRMRDLQSTQSVFDPAYYRKMCDNEMELVETIFKKLISASNLADYTTGTQSLYTIVNCSKHEIGARTTFGVVSVDLGTIRHASSEGEIAFVIGHEIGHHLLGHDVIPPPNKRSAEKNADQVALSLILAAGYFREDAIAIIHKFEAEGTEIHGKPAERITNLTKACR